MSAVARVESSSAPSVVPARLAIAAAAATLGLLSSLHVLSPELDPTWRMVSEYAYGRFGWVLSLMFLAWALASWALAVALRARVVTRRAQIGWAFLVLAGAGQAMASVFDVQHPLHSLAALIGIPSLPIAALLITGPMARERAALRWAAHSTWVSVVLLAVAFALLITTFVQAGGDVSAEPDTVTTLPQGVIAVVGLANRALVVAYCAWVAMIAWHVAPRAS
ncbi:DUF998 domain-containing protein [Sandaracinus amylolyticus]|uniref:DUF998 domain-containing protein n=1 Tax=Sandaracinus amylolyticus TaxID=927083 RepID=UPI001F44274E|nr:DUF998 domain-containing protein [Sandaracinus amylolyticus]UJR78449.1 DUF998 domain-containing protein [Sandaracinus amylolyticus]